MIKVKKKHKHVRGPEDGSGLEAAIQQHRDEGWSVAKVVWKDYGEDVGFGSCWKATFCKYIREEVPDTSPQLTLF